MGDGYGIPKQMTRENGVYVNVLQPATILQGNYHPIFVDLSRQSSEMYDIDEVSSEGKENNKLPSSTPAAINKYPTPKRPAIRTRSSSPKKRIQIQIMATTNQIDHVPQPDHNIDDGGQEQHETEQIALFCPTPLQGLLYHVISRFSVASCLSSIGKVGSFMDKS